MEDTIHLLLKSFKINKEIISIINKLKVIGEDDRIKKLRLDTENDSVTLDALINPHFSSKNEVEVFLKKYNLKPISKVTIFPISLPKQYEVEFFKGKEGLCDVTLYFTRKEAWLEYKDNIFFIYK